MTEDKPTVWALRLALVAGILDVGAGASLVLIPAQILPWVGVSVPASNELVFLRFVGAFVFSVGGSYLWALRRPRERLQVILGATILFRVSAGLYAAAAVVAGELGLPWLSVTVTDFGLVAAQGWLLSKGAGRDR